MDHFCSFCETLDKLSPLEASYLVNQLEPVRLTVFGAVLGDEDTLDLPIPGSSGPVELPRFLAESDKQLDRFRAWANLDEDQDRSAGFGHEWLPTGTLLLKSSDGNDNPYRLAYFIRKFLFAFREDECFGFTYCSKISDEPYGGAFFITAAAIEHMDAFTWLKERSERFKEA